VAFWNRELLKMMFKDVPTAVKTLDTTWIGDLAVLEDLVSAGKLTVDDVAAFVNAKLSADAWARLAQNFSSAFFASVLKSAKLTASRAQAILYSMVNQGLYDKLLELLTYDASDTSITSSTTLTSGVSRYRKLSIASGVTLSVGADPGVIIADTILNRGTIASDWVKGAGGSSCESLGVGGNGPGAVILLARKVTIGTVVADGSSAPNASGATAGCTAAGERGGAGAFWVISGDSVPYGGTGGYLPGSAGQNGGSGSGAAYAAPGGAGGGSTITTFSTYVDLLSELLKAAADWWLINVAGKTPSSYKSFPSLGGSGGGGAGQYSGSSVKGGGGGGGGQIIIYGTTVNAGTVTAKGGDGGNSTGSGGGGGGGGIIYVFFKSFAGSFSFDVSGGLGTGPAGGRGTDGGSGVARTFAV